MCGGFTYSKNSLTALNIFYILVAFILIGVATYGKAASVVTSVSVIGGIAACGVFLLLLAIVGLIGAQKHHQVLLFFYMVVLFLLFIIQVIIAIVCLAISKEQQELWVERGWNSSSNGTRAEAQNLFGCCGFYPDDQQTHDHPPCPIDPCCPDSVNGSMCCMTNAPCKCNTCRDVIQSKLEHGASVSGGLGLFFSFTEIFGVVIAYRYRHQIDPRANIEALM